MSNEATLAGFSGQIVLVGAGQMGGALLRGWLRLGLNPSHIVLLDPKPSAAIHALCEAGHIALNPPQDNLIPDIIILAIKPQIADEVMGRLRGLAGARTLILSVMAGKTIAGMEAIFGKTCAIIRTIPNTPAQVGRGITGAVGNAHVTPAHRETAQALLSAAGQVEWVADEGLIDAITAVSGSGPAYVFHLVEALAKAGAQAGLPPDLALRLARATVEGAGELLHRAPEVPPETLRANVTSPNGTTHAALQVIMAPDGVEPIYARAVAAATRRSKELAG